MFTHGKLNAVWLTLVLARVVKIPREKRPNIGPPVVPNMVALI